MNAFNKIIVHGGSSHLDEVWACALAMAEKTGFVLRGLIDRFLPIYRREPTHKELIDPTVICIDVGSKAEAAKAHDKDLNNWDHHQLPRGTKDCAMSLIAKDTYYNGVCMWDIMHSLFPWWETRISIDSCGPYKTAAEAGVDWSTVCRFLGPLEDVFLGMFENPPDFLHDNGSSSEGQEDVDAMNRGYLVYTFITKKVIEPKVKAFFDVQHFIERTSVGGVEVLDFTKADPVQAAEVLGALSAGATGVTITHSDPRNPGETWETTGLTLYRLRDDPRIDFSRIAKDPEVTFAHSGGFIACTKSKNLEEAKRLIRASIV